MEQNIPERVTRLEAQANTMQADIAEIKTELKQSATKDDVEDLKVYFTKRDEQYTANMWKVIYGLLILLGGLVVTMFAVKELPKLFM